MDAAEKLTALLKHVGVNTEGTVEIDGHTYGAWGPNGAPYEFRLLADGRRQLRVTTLEGEVRAAAGATNREAVEALAAKLGLTF